MEGGGLSCPHVGGVPCTPTSHPVDVGKGLPPPARSGGAGGGSGSRVDEETCKLRLVIFRLAMMTMVEEGKHGFDFLGDEYIGKELRPILSHTLSYTPSHNTLSHTLTNMDLIS